MPVLLMKPGWTTNSSVYHWDMRAQGQPNDTLGSHLKERHKTEYNTDKEKNKTPANAGGWRFVF